VLRSMIARSSTPKLGKPNAVFENGVSRAHVLIFNHGRRDECVYTLSKDTDGSGTYVLAFEEPEDADRFAEQLQLDGFGAPVLSTWDVAQINEFCSSVDMGVSLVPTGTLLTPPTRNFPPSGYSA